MGKKECYHIIYEIYSYNKKTVYRFTQIEKYVRKLLFIQIFLVMLTKHSTFGRRNDNEAILP